MQYSLYCPLVKNTGALHTRDSHSNRDSHSSSVQFSHLVIDRAIVLTLR